jgi:hypothetical protein
MLLFFFYVRLFTFVRVIISFVIRVIINSGRFEMAAHNPENHPKKSSPVAKADNIAPVTAA